jgi:hypothetical protein
MLDPQMDGLKKAEHEKLLARLDVKQLSRRNLAHTFYLSRSVRMAPVAG